MIHLVRRWNVAVFQEDIAGVVRLRYAGKVIESNWGADLADLCPAASHRATPIAWRETDPTPLEERMKQPTAPTLSAHLLQEATKFDLYPETIKRTRRNLEVQAFVHNKVMKSITQWRKTFAPHDEGDFAVFFNPWALEEFYCRDLLNSVPSIVERTLKLKPLVLSGVPPSQHLLLVEAGNCYIYGLSQAAVALARAAMEESLRSRLSKSVGKTTAKSFELNDLIEELHRTKCLSRDGRTRADRVREAGNNVLHGGAASAPDALAAIEDARAVIFEVSRHVGHR